MKKLFLLGLLGLLFMVACQNNEEIIPEQKTKSRLLQRTPITIEDSDVDPVTHDDLPGFEYAEGSDSSTASVQFIYKSLLVEFVEGTTEEEKTQIRNKYAIEGLNGWELFFWEKCDINPNVEFWSVRTIKEGTEPKPGPGDGLDEGEPIICTAKEVTEKKCNPQ